MNSQRIIFLDYMRIIAFSVVLIGHKFSEDLLLLATDTSKHITLRTFYGILADLTHGGAMGVVIFFLVSGYIITHVLQKEKTLVFYIKRFFRIYPLYISVILLGCVLKYIQDSSIPPANILIPRLLLLGDFFDTPLALGGVEWTLRVEILFYLFMGVMKKTKAIESGNLLTITLLSITLIISNMTPFPVTNDFHNAYLTIYSPFLFIGVIFYLLEHRLANGTLAIISIITMAVIHLNLVQNLTPSWANYNHAVIGIFIFAISIKFQENFSGNKACITLSDVTYAVYLLHLTAWGVIESIVNRVGIIYIDKPVQILVLLFIACYIANRTIERWGIMIGKKVIHKAMVQ